MRCSETVGGGRGVDRGEGEGRGVEVEGDGWLGVREEGMVRGGTAFFSAVRLPFRSTVLWW